MALSLYVMKEKCHVINMATSVIVGNYFGPFFKVFPFIMG